jgi:hypothetical protein
MGEKRDNYKLQVAQAKRHFLTYDQRELAARCGIRFDERYFYFRFLTEDHRLCRTTGDMQRLHRGEWVDANGFHEVMTVLDWLCDSRADRYITGRWVNLVSLGHSFHTQLQEEGEDPLARCFDRAPDVFRAACEALKGEPLPGGDISYAIELTDGLRILVQLWHGDEEFPPRLRLLWDENTTRYIRYETAWYAAALLRQRLRENIPAA